MNMYILNAATNLRICAVWSGLLFCWVTHEHWTISGTINNDSPDQTAPMTRLLYAYASLLIVLCARSDWFCFLWYLISTIILCLLLFQKLLSLSYKYLHNELRKPVWLGSALLLQVYELYPDRRNGIIQFWKLNPDRTMV